MARDRWFSVAAGGYTVVLLVACLVHLKMTGPDLPGGGLVPHLDKLAHFGAFAVLAVLWMLPDPSRWQAARVFVLGAAYGVGIEVLQGWMASGRDADVFDALADMIGLAAGLVAYRAVAARIPGLAVRATPLR